MIKTILKLLIPFLIVSCEHGDYNVTKFTGDYRHYAGISEFFDCDTKIKYYLADKGIYEELQTLYASLEIAEKDDVYIEVNGYFKEEQKMDGIHPAMIFVPVKLLNHDINRGCKQGFRQGN